MKKGQNPKYRKEYFQPVNNQKDDWWRSTALATPIEKRNIARKSKTKRKKK